MDQPRCYYLHVPKTLTNEHDECSNTIFTPFPLSVFYLLEHLGISSDVASLSDFVSVIYLLLTLMLFYTVFSSKLLQLVILRHVRIDD